MDKKLRDVLDYIRFNAVLNYSDGETSFDDILRLQCEDLIEIIVKEDEKKGALAAGIPLSVIEGKTKLSDHFSENYINWMSGKDK
jgi:hypothetical protein